MSCQPRKFILSTTFERWKKQFDPDDQWLEGRALSEGSKKIGTLTCRVCPKVGVLRSVACLNCCDEFVDEKSYLVEENIRKHAECTNHLQAMEHVKNQQVEAVATDIEVQVQELGMNDHELQLQKKAAGKTTNINSGKGPVFTDCAAENIIVNQIHNPANPSKEGITSVVSKTLRKAYEEMTYQVQAEWLPSGNIDFEDYFLMIGTEVKVADNRGYNIKIPTNTIKLECLFDYVKSLKPTRIVLESTEAMLASIAVIQLCQSWSSSQGPAMVFELVVLVDGRKLLTNTLEDLIVKRCHTEGVDDEVLLSIITENSNVLLILDHLSMEDLAPNNREALNVLFQSTTYESVTVVIVSQMSQFYISPRPKRDSTREYHVACNNAERCTKLIQMAGFYEKEEEIKFVTTNLLGLLPQPEDVTEIKAELESYFTSELLRLNPIFLLMLIYVFSQDCITADIYKGILKRLMKDHFEKIENGSEHSLKLYDFYDGDAPPEVVLLSTLGEYILEMRTNGNSCLAATDFGYGQASILEFGFVQFYLQYDKETQIEQLDPVHEPLLEFFMAYHVSVFCRTQNAEQILQKLDLLNSFLPLNASRSLFIRSCLSTIFDDVPEKVCGILRKHRRLKYWRFINDLEFVNRSPRLRLSVGSLHPNQKLQVLILKDKLNQRRNE